MSNEAIASSKYTTVLTSFSCSESAEISAIAASSNSTPSIDSTTTWITGIIAWSRILISNTFSSNSLYSSISYKPICSSANTIPTTPKDSAFLKISVSVIKSA